MKRMEMHTIFLLIQGDVDLFAVCLDEKPDEEKSKRTLSKIGPEAFKTPLLTHRSVIITGLTRVGKISIDNTKLRVPILREDQAKKVSMSLNHFFCLNREPKKKKLPNYPKR